MKSSEVFSPSDYGFKKFEWVKKPTHIPEPRKQTFYGIEVVEMHGNPVVEIHGIHLPALSSLPQA